ncbi:hypothetical protein B0H14DRAFT_2596547 [Mycena olivaceomarginata]|nr:hypothetical protein B0H14DRAFT_2596547 [Mycena olivaceomarginata]
MRASLATVSSQTSSPRTPVWFQHQLNFRLLAQHSTLPQFMVLLVGVTDARDVEIRHNSDSRGNWCSAYLMESMWSVRRHGIGNKQSGKGISATLVISHRSIELQCLKIWEHSLTVQDCCKIYEVDPPSKLKLYAAKATRIP